MASGKDFFFPNIVKHTIWVFKITSEVFRIPQKSYLHSAETCAHTCNKTSAQRKSCPVPSIFLTSAPFWFSLITLLTAFIFTMNSFLPFCYFILKYSLFKCKQPLTITEILKYLHGSPEYMQYNIPWSRQIKRNSASLCVYWWQIFCSNIRELSTCVFSDFLKIRTLLFQWFLTIILNNLVHISARTSDFVMLNTNLFRNSLRLNQIKHNIKLPYWITSLARICGKQTYFPCHIIA